MKIFLSSMQSKMRLYLKRLLILLLLFSSLITCSYASPIQEFPSFKRLSTEQGLPQDTIYSMMLDKQGFLWIGTENGLSRYDGYRVQNIEGKNAEIKDKVVNYLFEDEKQNLFISVENVGLYAFNKSSQYFNLLIQLPYKNYPSYYQSVTKIIEVNATELIVVLEENVVIFNRETFKHDVIFSLPENFITEEHIIRDAISIDDVLVFATSGGALAYQKSTQNLVNIDYLGFDETNADKLNSKKLLSPDNMHLWIGTVEGLYQINLDEMLAYVNEQGQITQLKTLATDLNIWDIRKLDDDTYYLATHEGLFTYSISQQSLQHIFKPTDSRYYIADDDLVTIQIDLHNNLWLGTRFDGAVYWSPKNLTFSNVYRKNMQTGALSDNQVWSFYQQNDQYLWVGTNNGLNRFDLTTGDIDPYLVNPDSKTLYSGSTIEQILQFDEQNLLLVTPDGFSLFNHQTGITRDLKVTSTDLDIMNSYPWGVQSDGNGSFYFLTETGWHVYDSVNQRIKSLEVLNSRLDQNASYGFLKPDIKRPNKLIISMPNELWEFDTQTSELRLINSVEDSNRKADSFPESYLFTEHNLYISYSGFGMAILDKDNFETIEIFNKTNGLHTTTLYGLQQSQNGDLWLSSHSGLINFDPKIQTFKSYSQSDGLLTNEYNAFASLKLVDGRLVYGNVKGFTIFNPSELTKKLTEPSVYITGSSLNSEDSIFNFDSYQQFSKKLNYDDVGYTLLYSTLKYEALSNTDYKVELTGDTILRFPISKEPSVVIPKLSPGTYQLSISAKDTSTGKYGKPSIVNVTVDYFVLMHPLAITIYILIIVILTAFWVINRNRQLSEIRLAHQQTLSAKNKLKHALNVTNSGTWELSSNGSVYLSDTYEKLGYDDNQKPTDFYGHLELVHPADKEKVQKHWDDVLFGNHTKLEVVYRIKANDGKFQWYRDTGKLANEHDKHKRIIGTSTNITGMIADQEKATIFGEALKQTNDWVLFFDENYQLVNANPSFLRAMSIKDTEALNESYERILSKQNINLGKLIDVIKQLKTNERLKYEDKLVLPNNEQHYVLINITSIDNPLDLTDTHFYLAIISDINEQKHAEQKLRKLANYDNLTGLPNRVLLLDRIDHALQSIQSKKQMLALMFLDLDRFKQVNDSLGHNVGDDLLIVVSKRLQHVCDKSDTVARLGGDEFVIMKERIESLSTLSLFAQTVINAVEQPVQLSNQIINISTSIGIAIAPDDANTASDLMKNADLAMYSAKDQGRGCFQLFTNELNKKLHDRLYMENKLQVAYQLNQLINFYQPIVDVERERIIGFELLLRWQDDNKMISPSEFIVVAEEIGLIENLTLQAIKRAAPTIKNWQALGFDGYLSINLSARHIEEEISVDRIVALVKELSIPTNTIQFEITESAIMRNYEDAQNCLQKLYDAGFYIALDDFGTGYSSLKYLKLFPIHTIKIDRSFVFDVGLDKNDEAIISAILKMAESLNLECIAEGVETKQQLTFLSTRKCVFQQGYFFSPPVPADTTIELLNRYE